MADMKEKANIKKEEELSFEESVGRLENIVAALEKGDAELDRSLSLFEEGIALVKSCTKKLDEAEQRVKILVDGKEEDFAVSGEQTGEKI